MKAPLISSKKITISSDYNYFDLLPIKKYQQCNIRIPETVLLEKGFVKDWVFNSHKIPNHPILKKKRQNMSTLAVVKCFCIRSGYGQQIQGCANIRDVKQKIEQAVKQQKDYDFIKDKKVIQITTVSNQVLTMTLMDFLDYVSENKHSDQSFYEKWKIIQQKVSFTKIDEYYKVQNVRDNHVVEHKCQKIISVNTSEATIHSTQLQDDPYKNSSPNKNFTIAETKNLEGYKFFDTFLNKKFFQMSQQLIDFIEKNFKCIVESVNTKFVINKEREPHLVGISDLQIKPAKKIADMREFQAAKQKGFIRIEQYVRFLDTYIQQNMERYQSYNINTPITQRRTRCRGKMCKVSLQEVNIPPLLQQKLKLALASVNSRVVSAELRDAIIKRKRKVTEKLIENKVVSDDYEIHDQSSQYESQGDNEDLQFLQSKKIKNKQAKVCSNCYCFYFHAIRFYDLDIYGNLVQKKTTALQTQSDKKLVDNNYNQNTISFLTKQQIKRQRSFHKPSPQKQDRKLNQLAETLLNEKQDKQRLEAEQKLISTIQRKQLKSESKKTSQQPKYIQKYLSPIKKEKASLSKTQKNIKSERQLPPNSKSKVKLDPIAQKQALLEGSLANNPDTKGNRLLTLSKLSQPNKLQQKTKSKTMHGNMSQIREKKPQNYGEASEQLIKKLSGLPDSSKQQLIYFAKKYYKDNLPQPIQRKCYSSYYQAHLYQFMNISPVSIHPKRRIKKRPEMSLKRLSELTDYPEIVSRSEFVFDTIIVNEQTTIPFCVLTTKVVNPDNLKSGQPFQNIFIINDLFDSFIQHISTAKELLQEDQVYNKRIILFNYAGQSHTIYNRGNLQAISPYFAEIMDKLVFRLSRQKNQLKIIDLEKDHFKFCALGLGGVFLAHYLGSYSLTFEDRIVNTLLVNSFMRCPKRYKEVLESLLELFKSNDPTAQSKAHLYYNKAINSEENSEEEMEHKAGLNPIRVDDRVYLLSCVLNQINQSETSSYSIEPTYFQDEQNYHVSVVYGKNNTIISKDSCFEFIRGRNDPKKQLPKRVFIQIDGGHDIFSDNYEDIFRILTLFLRK